MSHSGHMRNIKSALAFDFIEFAREIYAESPAIYVDPPGMDEKFLIPALYGGDSHGESSGPFQALIVLEEPSESFTKRTWKAQWTVPCMCPEEAINRHRQIFFQWAFIGLQAEIFGLFGEPSTAGDFFRRLYVTDVWKDAAFRKNRKPGNRSYGRYWRAKLATEIKSVSTERIILVGAEARRSGWQHVPPGTPTHVLAFPSWRNTTFREEVRQLRTDIL
jgi:hypothetical protein